MTPGDKRLRWVTAVLFAAVLCVSCSQEDSAPGNVQPAPPAEPVDLLAELRDDSPEVAQLRRMLSEVVQAHKGDALTSDLNTGSLKMRATGEFAPGMVGEVTIVESFRGAGKLRRHITGKAGDDEVDLLFVVNGNASWMRRAGEEPQALPPPPTPATNFLAASFAELWEIPDATHLERGEGIPTVDWIQIEFQTFETQGTVFIDPETNLIASSAYWMADPKSGYAVSVQLRYFDYQQFGQMTLPTRIIANKDGEEWLETEILELDLDADVPPERFEKPGS